MKKRYSIIVGVLALSFVAANCAHSATTSDYKNYGTVQLGLYEPTSDLDNGDYDTGFNGSVAYGRYLAPNLVAEAMIDYVGTSADVDGENSILGKYDQDSTISGTGLLFSLKGVMPAGPVDLYGGAGIGLYLVNLSIEIDSDRLGKFEEENDTDTVFGAHLSAGANYNINERFYVGLEGRYRWTGDAKVSDRVANVPVSYEGDLTGFSVAATFGMRF